MWRMPVLVVILGAALPLFCAHATLPTPEAQPLSTEQLRALLRNEDPARVAFALYQLAGRGDVTDPGIKALCTHKDPYVRRAAVFALGTARDATNTALLSKAVRDADPGVRRAAVFALANAGGEGAVPRLEGALNDPHPAVRELAATGLGRLGGEKAVRLLIGALDDPSLRVRRAAVVALGVLGDARSLAPLRALRDDPGRGVSARLPALVQKKLNEGHNFGYEFLTLAALVERFRADTGIPTFVTDEALMAVALAAEDPDNLDSLKVSMWHVKARTFLDELTQAAGLVWIIEERWVIVTPAAYLAYDTPLDLEVAGALYRLGDASAKSTLQRFAKQDQWSARAEALLKKD
jgi:hypothetical protein